MPMNITLEQGRQIVRIAREVLEEFVINRKVKERSFNEQFLNEKRGVFVTLNKIDNKEKSLRGCIGFPYPVKELGSALVEATVAAASQDPRFEPVSSEELDRIIVEVSVLTLPERIEANNARDLPNKIKIGRDGLIVATNYTSGLLLPQVAVELNLDPVEFLSEACMKAGLLPDAWLTNGVSIFRFQAEIFAEREPRGEILRIVY